MNFNINNELNTQQKKAILLPNTSNVLVLAGAGSGKTKVLTQRIAYLIGNNSITVNNILALTFTNKAANEMRERLTELLRMPISQGSWIGTFHSLSHKILRLNSADANLSSNFQIIDSSDQNRIIKRILKEEKIDDKKFSPRQFISFINSSKDNGLRYDDIDSGHNFFIKKSLEIFKIYQEYCDRENLIDFAEILIRCYELLKNKPTILEKYQNQFKYILVDEFQDTNYIQYNLIKLLKKDDNSIFCVGDDDQSIYGWRGAKIENINNLSVDFAPLSIIKLEQNYRSTGNILKASNALIANNYGRMSKTLWTSDGDGELIDIFEASDEKKEAEFIAKQILILQKNNINLNKCAVLYRAGALSRTIEDSFIKNKINYIIYGGLRFFDRAEIKNAMHYLRLVTDFNDNIAFERIVNFPTRGIGSTTIYKIQQFALDNYTSFFQASKKILPTLSTRASNSLNNFIQIIENLNQTIVKLELGEKLKTVIDKSGLSQHYENDKTDKAGSKTQNLKELIGAASVFTSEDETIDSTTAFIAASALDSGANKDNQDCVQLMTIHSAKGLEFENVFLIGLEEDLFPSRQSKEEPHLMLEERRLCYVAMTRAKNKLTISFAGKRFLYGNSFYTQTSRFLSEVPSNYFNKIYFDNYTESTKNDFSNLTKFNSNEYEVNTTVIHKKFGIGKVKKYEGGENARVEVNFTKFGRKWLILEYAKLEKL